ncbi:hypothetical protein AVEN_238335-1 [Araneus ventricosus]|uniref:Integrase catalytic domain-containing protein n=1 Tax=Araneus ventricosus TaxID=182803 RepID=A0A4Y2KEZ2_ARAVE|nr:hypothetical protein AVEN_238335-1 [Araneus ventricosus]
MLSFRLKARRLRRIGNVIDEEFSMHVKYFFRSVQAEYFATEEGTKSLIKVYKCDECILRLKSRLTNEDEARDFIYPLSLPSKHPILKLLIEQVHFINNHAGTLTLLAILRERFWILRGKRTLRNIGKEYLICKQLKVKSSEVPFPPLPKDRTKISAVFQVMGIDLAGPLLTKSREKVWIVLFSFAFFRAVHLELIPSLNTNTLIQAIRKFISRRGQISTVYSENGTNFTGLNTALKQLDWIKIQEKFEVNQMRWMFNPPSAAWWGRFWERLIGLLKDLLRENLGRSYLTYEELQTLLRECEAVMNNRLLTSVSEDQCSYRIFE